MENIGWWQRLIQLVQTFDAYKVVNIKTAAKESFGFSEFLDIPERPIIIVLVIGVVISLVGLKLRN